MLMATPTTTTPTRRSALTFGAATIVAGITAAASASTTSGQDAELIALCDLFTENEARQFNLYVTIRDDDERDAALGPLSVEWNDLFDRIGQIEGPTSLAGARAMARAAIATMLLGVDGKPEPGRDPEDWFGFCVARYLAGSAGA